MFQITALDLADWDAFSKLSTNVQLQPVTKGRLGANLVSLENGLVPLVRTTTRYTNPNQIMTENHQHLLGCIQKVVPCNFNNALLEIYDNRYCTMGYHSDQALDLDEKSSICIFSCYNQADTKSLRTLHIKNKTRNETTKIVLQHNSIVTFSVTTNANFVHKITLDNPGDNKVQWLGVTLRTSKTFIEFRDDKPYFHKTDTQLVLAGGEQEKQFFKQRSLENATTDHVWPVLDYTLSPGDLEPCFANDDIFTAFNNLKTDLDSVFEMQQISPRTKRFMYAMMSRLLHSDKEDEEHKGAW